MEKLPIKGSWPRVSKRVKDAYPYLNDEDLTYKRGRIDDLLDRLERKTGKEKEELISWLSGLSRARL